MFRPLRGHHQAFYLKQVFKILHTLLGSHQCLQIIGRPLPHIDIIASLLFVNINGIPVMYAVF
jgi:hypothetical protein